MVDLLDQKADIGSGGHIDLSGINQDDRELCSPTQVMHLVFDGKQDFVVSVTHVLTISLGTVGMSLGNIIHILW